MGRIHGHHIVMKESGGIFGDKGRKILENYGIDVLYTPKDLKNASPTALHNMSMALNGYRSIHSNAYAKAVWEKLDNAVALEKKRGYSKDEIKGLGTVPKLRFFELVRFARVCAS